MSHIVKCAYCGSNFDRDKIEYAQISARRYAHASCALREKEKNPKLTFEVIDPTDKVVCAYCKKELSKKSADCVQLKNGKYVHTACQALEEQREKTDKEKLEEYIMKLFNTPYVNPRIRQQINHYIAEYHFTYSGIQKTLYYFYEIKCNDIQKANGTIGIVPYVYQQASNYFYKIWEAQQKNLNVQIDLYTPKVKEIVIQRPQRKTKKRPLFTFLDEEEDD